MGKFVEFDGFAHQYDELLRHPAREMFAGSAGFFHRRKWEVIERLRLDVAGAEWLDVGCGRGELLRCGAGKVRRATGCDPSAEMLAAAVGLDVRRQDDPGCLPYADASFDLVTAACVFHHLAPPEQATLAREMRRVARAGGLIAIFEHNPFNPLTQWIVRTTPVDRGARLLTAWRARRLLAGAGLRADQTLYYLYLPERFYRCAAGLERALRRIPLGGQWAVTARRVE
ncbi:MAG: class I SAM-dependent methyltransferase [Bryobacteraceae bacterium]